ncbi:hypothetical protein GQ600_8907 [Phytophthora cactorum]|nr:hypothetical protein GQ600_8907 [Phytophthora cactorum]
MSDKSDGGTASGVWVPSSPSSSSSDSSDSEPYKRGRSLGGRGNGKEYRTRRDHRGAADARTPSSRNIGLVTILTFKRSQQWVTVRASELPESGTEAPESGSTSSMGVSVADAGNDGVRCRCPRRLVYVPELDRKVFESWDVLEAYLRTYSRRTFQVRTIRTSCARC